MNNDYMMAVLNSFCQAWLRCSYPGFLGSICLTFSQYSNLNFMTLSVPAWLLLTVFFYDLIPTSVTRYTWLFYPPNFPSVRQITHTILVRLHRDVLPLFLSTLLWNYSEDCISVSPWASAVNFPRFFVAWPVFELSFYWRKIWLLFFRSTASVLDGLLLFFFANQLNMLSLMYF